MKVCKYSFQVTKILSMKNKKFILKKIVAMPATFKGQIQQIVTGATISSTQLSEVTALIIAQCENASESIQSELEVERQKLECLQSKIAEEKKAQKARIEAKKATLEVTLAKATAAKEKAKEDTAAAIKKQKEEIAKEDAAAAIKKQKEEIAAAIKKAKKDAAAAMKKQKEQEAIKKRRLAEETKRKAEQKRVARVAAIVSHRATLRTAFAKDKADYEKVKKYFRLIDDQGHEFSWYVSQTAKLDLAKLERIPYKITVTYTGRNFWTCVFYMFGKWREFANGTYTTNTLLPAIKGFWYDLD